MTVSINLTPDRDVNGVLQRRERKSLPCLPLIAIDLPRNFCSDRSA